MVKISIIIPVYNAEKFIAECLNSILDQSLQDIEIVCIDDGSTDNSVDIIESFRKKDNRIVLGKQKNSGSGSARNNAILNYAQGEFIAFMDSDDWYPDKKVLETLYTKATENKVKIAGGSFIRYYADGRVESEFNGVYKAYKFESEGLINYTDYQFDYGYHRFIYNLDMLKGNNIIFPDYRRFQDPPFFVNAMLAAEKFYAIKAPVYAYRKGHQFIQWDIEKLTGLIRGLQEDLMLSRRNKLANLHGMTVMRLESEFKKIIIATLKQVNSKSINFALYRFYSTIDMELVKISDFPFQFESSEIVDTIKFPY